MTNYLGIVRQSTQHTWILYYKGLWGKLSIVELRCLLGTNASHSGNLASKRLTADVLQKKDRIPCPLTYPRGYPKR